MNLKLSPQLIVNSTLSNDVKDQIAITNVRIEELIKRANKLQTENYVEASGCHSF